MEGSNRDAEGACRGTGIRFCVKGASLLGRINIAQTSATGIRWQAGGRNGQQGSTTLVLSSRASPDTGMSQAALQHEQCIFTSVNCHLSDVCQPVTLGDHDLFREMSGQRTSGMPSVRQTLK
jgi:hypothetical protein